MTLHDEILSRADCANALAARDCGALATILSTGRTKTIAVPIADLQAYLQGNGTWWGIKAIAANTAHAAYPAACAAMDVTSARYENIDMSLPIVSQMLGGLVAASAITQADMDALIAMSIVPDVVAPQEVVKACWSDNGTWLF